MIAARRALWLLPFLALAGVCTLAMLHLAGEGDARLRVVVLGAVVLGAGAYFSGNARLFCLWGLILTLPFDLSYRIGTYYQKLGGETSFRIEVSDLFWLPLLAYLARDVWTGAVRGVRIPKVTYIWIGIMVMGIGAVIVGPWRTTALHEVVRMVKVMLIFIVVCNELRTPGRFMQVVAALLTALVIQAVAGITQFVIGAPFGLTFLGEAAVELAPGTIRSAAVIRIGAFMIHPNLFAVFLATILPIAIALLLIRTGRYQRLMSVLAILLGVPALILTLSRAGWLSFATSSIVLAILIVLHPALRRRAVIPIAGVGVVLVVVAVVFSGPIFARIFESTGYSELGRDEWERDALRLIAVKPVLGWGLNSYSFAVPPFTRLGARGAREIYSKAQFAHMPFVPAVHNAYLTWLAEVGVVGLILHLALFVILIRTAYRNLRVPDEFLYLLNAACLASLIAFLVDLNFGNSLRSGNILREFWVLAAIIMGVHYWRLEQQRARSALPPGVPGTVRNTGQNG